MVERDAGAVPRKSAPKEPVRAPVQQKIDPPDDSEDDDGPPVFVKVLGVILILVILAGLHFWRVSAIADKSYKSGLHDGLTTNAVDPDALGKKDRDIQQLQQTLSQTKADLDSVARQRDRLSQSLRDTQALIPRKVTGAQQELERRIDGITEESRKKLADMTARMSAAQKAAGDKDDQLSSLQESLGRLQQERDAAVKEMVDMRNQLQTLRGQRTAALEELAKLKGDVREANAGRSKVEQELAQVKASLAAAVRERDNRTPAQDAAPLPDIDSYAKAIEANPNDVTARISRGMAYAGKGDYDNAIRDFDKTLQLAPGLIQAYTARGAAYEAKGELDKAMVDFNKALKINPSSAFSYFRRGDIYYLQGNISKAMVSWNKAIRLDSQRAFSHISYYYKGNHDKIIGDNSQVIKVYPDYVLAYYMRGAAFGAKGEHERAVADFSKVIELDPKYTDAYNNRAVAYFLNQEYAKALADVQEVQKLGGEVNSDFLTSLNIAVDQQRAAQAQPEART